MTLAEALASVDRLCPAEVGRTLRAHMTRPTGGHVIGRVVEQQSTRPDPRAEADEEPTRRERRPSDTAVQVERVVRRPQSGHFAAARQALDDGAAEAERVIGAPPWKAPP